jgi:hypothetical protein
MIEVDEVSALVLRDILPGKTSTMISDNMGVYDYEPEEKIVSVEVL